MNLADTLESFCLDIHLSRGRHFSQAMEDELTAFMKALQYFSTEETEDSIVNGLGQLCLFSL